jgi:membrane protein DedA with SNARE-associated domain
MNAEILATVESAFSQYGYAFVFLALFLENVLFLGALVPGVVVLVACGWLAQHTQASPYPVMLYGFLGTVCGDTVSYGLGRKIGGRLLRARRWGPGIAAMTGRIRAEPALLMLCHFISYFRLFVPMSAGVSRVPFWRWLCLDATGAALWVVSHVLIGTFLSLTTAGATVQQIGIATAVFLGIVIAVRHMLGKRRLPGTDG